MQLFSLCVVSGTESETSHRAALLQCKRFPSGSDKAFLSHKTHTLLHCITLALLLKHLYEKNIFIHTVKEGAEFGLSAMDFWDDHPARAADRAISSAWTPDCSWLMPGLRKRKQTKMDSSRPSREKSEAQLQHLGFKCCTRQGPECHESTECREAGRWAQTQFKLKQVNGT